MIVMRVMQRSQSSATGVAARSFVRASVLGPLRRVALPTLLGLLTLASPARADGLDGFGHAIQHNWDYARRAWRLAETELIVSGYAYHVPWDYTKAQRAHLNSEAWGGGLFKRVSDEAGDQHAIYAVAFKDSHFKAEYQLGYAWMRNWRLWGGLNGQLGYTVFLFARADIGHYAPLPGILPLVALGSDRIKLHATWLPQIGSLAQGNTLYLFITYKS